MEPTIRIIANIYFNTDLNNKDHTYSFNNDLTVDELHLLEAFLKDSPLIMNNIDCEDFYNFKLFTIRCHNEEEAQTVLHGLYGCLKNPVNEDSTNKNDNCKGNTSKNNSISSEIDYIAKNLDDTDLFLQLAEEAAELSQACLKYVRAYRGNNPTKDSAEVYLKNILEELTDVRVSADALNIEEDIDTYINKIHRWADRIRSKNAGEKK